MSLFAKAKAKAKSAWTEYGESRRDEAKRMKEVKAAAKEEYWKEKKVVAKAEARKRARGTTTPMGQQMMKGFGQTTRQMTSNLRGSTRTTARRTKRGARRRRKYYPGDKDDNGGLGGFDLDDVPRII
jgi:hypothetical protein